jgi:hypothetical protein
MTDKKTGNVFNVTSNQQSGGITAGQVIFQGRPSRTLHGRQIAASIVTKLQWKSLEPLSIMAWNPDAETQQFAQHFFDLATQLGWPVKSLPDTTICPDIINGISVRSKASASDSADPLRVLAEWLVSVGFDVEFVHGARENEIVVGPQR